MDKTIVRLVKLFKKISRLGAVELAQPNREAFVDVFQQCFGDVVETYYLDDHEEYCIGIIHVELPMSETHRRVLLHNQFDSFYVSVSFFEWGKVECRVEYLGNDGTSQEDQDLFMSKLTRLCPVFNEGPTKWEGLIPFLRTGVRQLRR